MSESTAIEVAQPLPTVPVPPPGINLYALMPIPEIDLTEPERVEVERYALVRTILGPTSSAPLTCPKALPPAEDPLGDEPIQLPSGSIADYVMRNKMCPHARSCPLLRQGKAPHEQLCPIEATYAIERFSSWVQDIGKTQGTLNEADRISMSELTAMDLQEHRCHSILGEAENARLADISVKETSVNGDPLAYEKVIHINQQILEGISNRRRKILHDYELTPEMLTKKAKTEGGSKGPDLATLQSARADKFKARRNKQSA